MGPGSPLAVARVGRDDSRFSLKHQPAAVRNGGRRNFHCFRLILSMKIATPTCSASEVISPPYVTHDVAPSVCVNTRRHHVAPSFVTPCVTNRRHNVLCI